MILASATWVHANTPIKEKYKSQKVVGDRHRLRIQSSLSLPSASGGFLHLRATFRSKDMSMFNPR